MSTYKPPEGAPPTYPQETYQQPNPGQDERGMQNYAGPPPPESQQYGQQGYPQYQQGPGPYGPGPYGPGPYPQQGPYPPQGYQQGPGYYQQGPPPGAAGAGDGICAGICAALACCCCLDLLL